MAVASKPLTPSQRRYLRGLCHNLKPLILIGNKGVTPSLAAELGQTLDHHELVKIKLSGGDREERQQQLDVLLEASGAELVQQIGHVASVFRRNPDQPRLALPN
ncbi:MAG TPA: YhbY family RNA-binding protein [Rhodanobacteraceae bacterium]